MKTLTRSILVLTLILSTGCSTVANLVYGEQPKQNLVWLPADGATTDQLAQDKKNCLHRAQFVKEDRFGRGQMTFYIQCMQSDGHKLVEMRE